MEHEVFVPVPVERLKEALGDPARVARAVPGFQQDAGAEPGTGRLKVRVGSHSITYRGAVRVLTHDDGSYAVEGEATEARGTGSVKLALTLRPRGTDGGTTLAFDATATADGRVTELPQDAVGSAVVRLLNRFAQALAEGRRNRIARTPRRFPGRSRRRRSWRFPRNHRRPRRPPSRTSRNPSAPRPRRPTPGAR